MATSNVSSPDFKSIADDFKAPDEITLPYQQHLTRVRTAFAALDGRWLGVKSVFKGLVFTPEEQLHIDNFETALTGLHSAVLNRSIDPNMPDQPPAKDAKVTY